MLFKDKVSEITPAIINKVIGGDEAAFELIYNHISGKIYAICFRYSNTTAEASTIFEKAFFNIHSNLISYVFNESFVVWAMDIAVFTCLKNNKAQIDNNFLEAEMKDVESDKWDDIIKSCKILSTDKLINALQDLNVGYRTVFNLYNKEGYNHVKISEILGITIENSKIQKKAC